MDSQLDLSNKPFPSAMPNSYKNNFQEFDLDDHDDDQIKAKIAVLSTYNPQVIEGKLW